MRQTLSRYLALACANYGYAQPEGCGKSYGYLWFIAEIR